MTKTVPIPKTPAGGFDPTPRGESFAKWRTISGSILWKDLTARTGSRVSRAATSPTSRRRRETSSSPSPPANGSNPRSSRWVRRAHATEPASFDAWTTPRTPRSVSSAPGGRSTWRGRAIGWRRTRGAGSACPVSTANPAAVVTVVTAAVPRPSTPSPRTSRGRWPRRAAARRGRRSTGAGGGTLTSTPGSTRLPCWDLPSWIWRWAATR
mmetsp:Transcript_1168/g.5063  ORF Transcript_1168/g.5063 Transcript_1168/m.5063 type:complete len:210 (+) Transcript_1168:2126-2755(+)